MFNHHQSMSFLVAEAKRRQDKRVYVPSADSTIRVARFPFTELAIVLPVFNEESRMHLVDRFVGKLCAAFTNELTKVAVYFVNDGSTDQTELLLTKMIAKYQRKYTGVPLRLINFAKNTRKSAPYIAAYHRINAQYYLFVDSDDSFDIEDIKLMIHTIRVRKPAAVIGKKALSEDTGSLARVAIRAINRLLSRPLLPKGITDSQTGLKIFSRRAVIDAFGAIRPFHGFASDLVVLNEMKKHNLKASHMEVEAEIQDGSHVDVIRDSINHFKILMSLYTMRDEDEVEVPAFKPGRSAA